jgi:hypothetical protein
MRLMWVGGPTTRIELGSFRILTDPTLGEGPEAFVMRRHPTTGELNVPIARLAPLPDVRLDDLDMVIASHLHADHFDTAAVERLDGSLPVLAKQIHDRGCPGLDQLALATLISSGRYDRHLRRMRSLYAARRLALSESLARDAPAVRLTGLAAGFHAIAHLPDGVTESAAITEARKRSVGLYGLSPPDVRRTSGTGTTRVGVRQPARTYNQSRRRRGRRPALRACCARGPTA